MIQFIHQEPGWKTQVILLTRHRHAQVCKTHALEVFGEKDKKNKRMPMKTRQGIHWHKP